MKTSDWTELAPCSGRGADFVPAEDAWRTAQDLQVLCLPHLPTCGLCPFRAECIALIKPVQVFFDGIAGGRLWCNGAVVDALDVADDEELAEPKLRASCGTEAGAREHSRQGEKACISCRQVGRLIAARRRDTRNQQLVLPIAS
ncbi:hypothetical protein BX257_4046 [Streptomyces sp. 3212.3]|uniref:hypothetical protein n=1 Tax=Streptomyces sp. 3212.3 TaxID=1938846 RepID=UPI000E22208B|nr:hypothetical protein [Streptomyces sp. 3212.3]REE61467.1 hypothetical protein BX257_4046 [Streptomyces sp. 3212.3]